MSNEAPIHSNSPQRILLCGHRSFAAQGLDQILRNAGHEVICFSRGPLAASGEIVTGPVEQIDTNPHLNRPFDVVINYIMLKDDSIEQNIAFIAALLRFCKARSVRHFIHISSISSFQAGTELITEQTPTEPVPEKKGSYGGPKTAVDLHLLANLLPDTKLTLLRPGFILGKGVLNPIVGTGTRLPWNKLLVIGNGKAILPMTSRTLSHDAVLRILAQPPAHSPEVLILAAPNSPTKTQFLEVCCRRLGAGKAVMTLSVVTWWIIAVAAECAARVLGQGKLKPYSKLVSRLVRQRFDASQTAKRLGMDLSVDWESELIRSIDSQERNFELPYMPTPIRFGHGRKVSFLGFGRIVRQKHLPALRKLEFTGQIRAYDLVAGATIEGVQIESIKDAKLETSDAYIVASPGPAHIQAIPILEQAAGPILVEKPLGMSVQELDRWKAFASSRQGPVIVCHNYRYKPNVAEMMRTLERYNPGRLDHVMLHFQSPPAANDSAAWLRNERKARTLLMDYAIHFMDLACMFGNAPWQIDQLRFEIDDRGHTRLIEGHLGGNYSIGFLLKQCFAPRRARLRFLFQNYSVTLGFFPETFAVQMADDNPSLYKMEYKASRRATVRKILDRAMGRDSDPAHATVIGDVLAGGTPLTAGLTVARLESFYRMLFELSDRVYGESAAT